MNSPVLQKQELASLASSRVSSSLSSLLIPFLPAGTLGSFHHLTSTCCPEGMKDKSNLAQPYFPTPYFCSSYLCLLFLPKCYIVVPCLPLCSQPVENLASTVPPAPALPSVGWRPRPRLLVPLLPVGLVPVLLMPSMPFAVLHLRLID